MIQYVETTKGKLPVKFGMAAMRDFGTATNRGVNEFSNLGENMSLADVIALVWAGLKQGHRVERKPFDLDQDDIADLMDDNENLVAACMNLWAESQATSPNGKAAKKKTGPRK